MPIDRHRINLSINSNGRDVIAKQEMPYPTSVYFLIRENDVTRSIRIAS